jgi:NMD protein affecting ribosome stability and mRNA decay
MSHNLDRFSRRLPGEGRRRCAECGGPAPRGQHLCQACLAAAIFDRREDELKLESEWFQCRY